MNRYIKLSDVLALLPKDDVVGPKPSHLRREVEKLSSVDLKDKCIISEKQLSSLLEEAYRYEALESGGVDNWSWYSESLKDYLNFIGYPDYETAVKKEIGEYKV